MSAPTPRSISEMLDELSAYAGRMGKKVDLGALGETFPRNAIDVQYGVYVQKRRTGEWVEKLKTVKLRFDCEPTHAEIVYELHRSVRKDLSEQDRHYFEGLELLSSRAEGAPVYSLLLGS